MNPKPRASGAGLMKSVSVGELLKASQNRILDLDSFSDVQCRLLCERCIGPKNDVSIKILKRKKIKSLFLLVQS